MRIPLVLSLVAVAAASQAADTFTLNGLAPNAGTLTVTTSLPGVNAGTFSAGAFSANLNSDPSILVYCADLGHFANYGVAAPVMVQDTATMGANYALAGQVYNKFASTIGSDVQRNAALQGAIWMAIYGTGSTGITLSDGTTGASALATTFLTSDMTGISQHASYFNVGSASQSMIGAAPVPEPASMAALGVGAMGFLRRRKRA